MSSFQTIALSAMFETLHRHGDLYVPLLMMLLFAMSAAWIVLWHARERHWLMQWQCDTIEVCSNAAVCLGLLVICVAWYVQSGIEVYQTAVMPYLWATG